MAVDVKEAAGVDRVTDPEELIQTGDRLFAAKDYLGAIEVYGRVLQQDPDNERALAGTIASLRMDHRPDEAGPLAERAVAVYPKSVRLLYERGMVRFDQGKHDLALRDFKDALTLDPHQADALQWEVVASSDAHRVAGRFGPAHERLAAALRDPVLGHSPHILNQEGLVEYDQKLFRQAAEWFRRGLEEDPNNTFSIEWLCRAEAASLAAQGRFDDADTLFEQALVKLPDSPTLLAERASLHLDQAKIGVTGFDEAMGFLARALQMDPVQLRIRLERPRSMLEAVERRRLRAVANNVVQFLLAQKRLSDAIALLQAMIDAAPDDLPLVDTLGWAYIRQGDLSAAKASFARIAARDPDNNNAVIGTGTALFHEGEYRAAETQFRRAREGAPRNPTVLTKLAWPLIQQEGADFTEASDLCRQVLELDPYRAQAYGCQGIIAYRSGRPREAEEFFLRSIQVNPGRGNRVDLAALYLEQGRFQEAEEQARTALSINPYDAQARVQLGKVRIQQNRVSAGLAEIRGAAATDPGRTDVQEELACALAGQGELGEAEQVLRATIWRTEEPKRFRLHLALCRVLVSVGEHTDRDAFYEDALVEADSALRLRPCDLDAHLYRGVTLAKLERYGDALKEFGRVAKEGRALREAAGGSGSSPTVAPRQVQAERYAAKLKSFTLTQRAQARRLRAGPLVVGGAAAAQVVLLWYMYMRSHHVVTGGLLQVLIPLLTGLLLVSFLLPRLSHLKLVGLEADVTESAAPVATGPRGEISFSTSSPSAADTR